MLTDIQSFFCNLSPLAIALASPFFILGISGTGTPSLSYIIIGGALLSRLTTGTIIEKKNERPRHRQSLAIFYKYWRGRIENFQAFASNFWCIGACFNDHAVNAAFCYANMAVSHLNSSFNWIHHVRLPG
ncbi:hypothetical protein ACFOLK_09350 [Marinococcus halophilus]|uniref:hypothetical protein n=1 Tax=Marinococcus halophilus TaxID=1371 RepID=UPI00117C190C|nr:hypothetical protein [Marinococcus halophilus]